MSERCVVSLSVTHSGHTVPQCVLGGGGSAPLKYKERTSYVYECKSQTKPLKLRFSFGNELACGVQNVV